MNLLHLPALLFKELVDFFANYSMLVSTEANRQCSKTLGYPPKKTIIYFISKIKFSLLLVSVHVCPSDTQWSCSSLAFSATAHPTVKEERLGFIKSENIQTANMILLHFALKHLKIFWFSCMCVCVLLLFGIIEQLCLQIKY